MKLKREGPFLIPRIQQFSDRIFNKKLKDSTSSEINSAQGRLLFSLWQGDHINIQELCRRTSLQKSTLTGILDQLENKEFLQRTSSRRDRRELLIELTDKNKMIHKSFFTVSTEMARVFYKGLSEHEVDLFEKTLKTVLHNLELEQDELKS